MTTVTRLLVRSQLALRDAVLRHGRDERGDVPGWVLVTLMTAGLVTVLWALANDQLKALFTRAMNSVSGP